MIQENRYDYTGQHKTIETLTIALEKKSNLLRENLSAQVSPLAVNMAKRNVDDLYLVKE